jgi:hypothetical protein
MMNLRNKRVAGPLALMISLVVTATMAVAWGGTATSTPVASSASVAKAPVAHTGEGALTSRVRGTTANGRTVTGKFVPLSFSKRNGKVFVRGLVQGVVHKENGSTRTFGVMRKLRVKSINGEPATARTSAAAARCRILNLVLGPLDLDLLGLEVHLNRVVLDIVAQSGAGNLLGNLLCAVAGLLDGGLQGALGRLVRLLNRILGRLGLGL